MGVGSWRVVEGSWRAVEGMLAQLGRLKARWKCIICLSYNIA